MYVLGVSLPSQESEQSCVCVREYTYQARRVSSHVYVLGVSLPSQESEQSCVCVRGIVTKPGK